jgi:hypothetical protein
MSTRQRDRKKSNFTVLTTSYPNAFFDFIYNNQNFSISGADLATFFGVSGPLQTVGEVSGIPALLVSGGVNYIRSIFAGSGILASLSPNGSVQLDHNLTADSTGEPVLIDVAAVSPTIRSLVGGPRIAVTDHATANAIVVGHDSHLALATHGGATVTIATVNTPVIIGATWTAALMKYYTHNNSGRWTLTAESSCASITATITADSAAGTISATFYVYVNGVQQAGSAIQVQLVAGSPSKHVLVWAAELTETDYVEVWVENNTDTANITVQDAIIRID